MDTHQSIPSIPALEDMLILDLIAIVHEGQIYHGFLEESDIADWIDYTVNPRNLMGINVDSA